MTTDDDREEKHLVQTRLNRAMAEWVQDKAAAEGLTVSGWLRRLLITQKQSIDRIHASDMDSQTAITINDKKKKK